MKDYTDTHSKTNLKIMEWSSYKLRNVQEPLK